MLEDTKMVILLVEDELQVRFFIWKLLKSEGFTVLTASNCEAALAVCRNCSGPIDLLLTDIEMPGLNGLELYRIIAAERPGIKAIVMSGNGEVREQSEAIRLPFLQKPFRLSDLADIIHSALGADTRLE
jgi:DNA-binding NtrC family response regulator